MKNIVLQTFLMKTIKIKRIQRTAFHWLGPHSQLGLTALSWSRLQVYNERSETNPPDEIFCYRGGQPGHKSPFCRNQPSKCKICGRTDRVEKFCQNCKKNFRVNKGKGKKETKIENATLSEKELAKHRKLLGEYQGSAASGSCDKTDPRHFVHALLGGRQRIALINTGAAVSITNIPLEATSDSLYIKGLNGKEVYNKSSPTPLPLANSENVYWTKFWVGENTVGKIIGVDILKDLEDDVLLSKDKIVLGCNETICLSRSGLHCDLDALQEKLLV